MQLKMYMKKYYIYMDYSRDFIIDQIVADYRHKMSIAKMNMQATYVESMFNKGMITFEQYKEYYLSEDPNFVPTPKIINK